jgi:signal transduction histidine kinase
MWHDADAMRPQRVSFAVGLFAALVAVGLGSAWLASLPPAIAVGTSYPGALLLGLASGLALAAAGCVAIVAYPDEQFGRLSVVASLSWFATGWTSPGVGIAVLFTAGLMLSAATPAVLAHAILTYRTARKESSVRVVVIAGYAVCVGLLGVLPTIVRATDAACAACPANLIGMTAEPALGRALLQVAHVVAAGWAGAVIAVGVRMTIRTTGAARRTLVPVLAPGLVAVAAFGIDSISSAGRASAGIELVDRAAWTIQAGALIVLAAGSVLRIARARRTRSAVARIVLELAGTDEGGLQERLRGLLADPELVLAYPAGGGPLVTVLGEPTVLGTAPGRRVTPLVRGGEVVAAVERREGIAEDADRMSEIIGAAGLALEHERLVAVSRARLAELRASRARVVDANDRERRRLERDLHDGAQQRLAGLALAIRLARSNLSNIGGQGDEEHGQEATLEAAESELRATIADVRDIAHGIYPAALADMGIGPALGALAEDGRIPFHLDAIPAERLSPAVESAAYFVISEAPAVSGAQSARVRASVERGLLCIDLQLDGAHGADLTELEDRVGAVDGTLAADVRGGSVHLTAEIPCVS